MTRSSAAVIWLLMRGLEIGVENTFRDYAVIMPLNYLPYYFKAKTRDVNILWYNE